MSATFRSCATSAALLEPWVREGLAAGRPERDGALFRLRLFLVAVSWFELERRRQQLTPAPADGARLVRDSAEAACASILRRLGDFHGQSRFPVWAAKFAIHETAAAARRSAGGKTGDSRDTNAAAPFPVAAGGEE